MSTTDRDPEVQRMLSDFEVPPYPQQYFRELQLYLDQDKKRQTSSKKRMFAAPLATAAAIAVFSVAAINFDMFDGRKSEQTPQVELASTVIANSAERIRTLNSLRGSVHVEITRNGSTEDPLIAGQSGSYTLLERADGSYLSKDTAGKLAFSYNAKTLTTEELFEELDPVGDGSIPSPAGLPGGDDKNAPKHLVGRRTTGVFGTGPEAGANLAGPLLLHNFGFIEDLVAKSDQATLETVTVNNKPAWRISDPTLATTIVGTSHGNFTVVVDKKTHLPVQFVYHEESSNIRVQTTFSNLDVNPTIGDNEFHIAFPSGLDVYTTDQGVKKVDADEVKSIVSYSPILPQYLPDGFELSAITAAESSLLETQLNTDAMVSRNVVTATYRRGIQSISVSTRSVNGADTHWVNPVGGERAAEFRQASVTLTKGYFAGVTVETYGRSELQAHLWGKHGGFIFSVQGDVSRDELMKVTESLK